MKIICDDYDFTPLSAAFENEVESDTALALEIILCDKAYIRELNKTTRKIDDVTDVLSYPSIEHIRGAILKKDEHPYDIDEEGNIFLGSIAICRERAEEQAAEYGHSFFRELNYLAAHGVLHLLGYDHIEDGDRTIMREVEERVLKKICAERGI